MPNPVTSKSHIDTKIPAHEQYAGIFAVYYILGELCASYRGANESLYRI